MKYSKISLILAAFAATACAIEALPETSTENQPEVQLYPMTFSAGADDGSAPDTKVTLEGKSVLWSATDKIKVFDGTEKSLEAFEITSGEGTTSATFSGSVADPSAKTYYALYPYQSDATCTASKITIGTTEYSSYLTVDLPETQTAVDNSVDPAAFIAVAVSDANGNFSFKNLNSLVKFQLSESDITGLESISISSNSLEAIAGSMNIAFNASGIPVQTYVNGKMDSYVTLNAPEDGFKKETDYYIAIRSIAFSGGLTITAKYQDGSCKHASSTNEPSKSLSRNSVLNLGSLSLKSGLPNDLYIAYLHGQSIDIAGTKVNKIDYPAGTLINSDKEIQNGVFFLNDGVSATLKTACKTIAIGRFSGRNCTVTRTDSYIRIAPSSETDYLLLKNVKLVLANPGKDAYLSAISADGTFESIIFDSCSIPIPSSTSNRALIQAGSANRIINSFIVKDCDIKLDTQSAETYLLKTTNSNIKNVVFKNNIIYSPVTVKNFFCMINTAAECDNVEFSRNTLVNVYPKIANGLVYVKNIKTSAYILNNLAYLVDYTTAVGNGYTSFVRENDGSYSANYQNTEYANKNYVIYNESIPSQRLKFAHGVNDIDGVITNVTKANSSSVMDYSEEKFDVNNGIFIPLDSNYGATRTLTGTETLSERQTWTGASGWTF